MALIKGENLVYREPLRKNDERGVRQSDIEPPFSSRPRSDITMNLRGRPTQTLWSNSNC